MGTLEIKCHNCGAVNVVTPDCIYHVEKMEDKYIYPWRCPHCMATMNRRLWNKLVNAFWAFEEVNKDLRSDTDCFCAPLMQAEYTRYIMKRTPYTVVKSRDEVYSRFEQIKKTMCTIWQSNVV